MENRPICYKIRQRALGDPIQYEEVLTLIPFIAIDDRYYNPDNPQLRIQGLKILSPISSPQ